MKNKENVAELSTVPSSFGVFGNERISDNYVSSWFFARPGWRCRHLRYMGEEELSSSIS